MRKTIHLLLILAGVAVVAYALNRNSGAASSPARLQVFRGTVPAFGDELHLTVKLPPHRAEIFTRLKEDVAAAAEALARASIRQLPAGEMSPVEPATWQLLQEARRLDALTADAVGRNAVGRGGDLLFQREGMKVGKGEAAKTVDLDLLARGAAVDAAAALARKYGIADASVELGGIRRNFGEPQSETATATLGASVSSGNSGGGSDAPNEKVATALDAAPPRVRDDSAAATVTGDGATITVITRAHSVVAAGLAERLGALPDAEREAAATIAVQNFPATEVWLARENGETVKIN
ncbi:MAG: hypothetical protein LBP75_01295 [Planctomycetota bacterium]|jgi:hypothetical protein|nr:hypothetical protein [Planctomycetota bacterium]